MTGVILFSDILKVFFWGWIAGVISFPVLAYIFLKITKNE